MIQIYKFTLALLFTTSLVTSSDAGENNHTLSYTMGFSYLNGSLDGYVQTPAGGEPGTTSRERPTFDELGFDQQPAFDAYGTIGKGHHTLEIGGQWQRQSGTSTLKEDLVSQKKFFPADTRVNADIQTDWYRVNYLYAMNTDNQSISLSVGGGLVWFNFDYQLKSAATKADRAYSKVGYRIGADMNWHINDRFNIETRIFAPIPLSNTPEIWTLELNAEYTLWETPGSRTLLVGGLGYNRLDYEDEQKIPNHIRVEISPYMRAGLKLDF
jgi:hypothetical protein